MNERIKELFKKAGGKTTTHNLASNPVQYREISELWDGHIDKFAELIVRECITIIRKRKDIAIDDDMNVDEAMSMAVFDIEDTFGVE
jgi:hypothetical protein